MDITQTKHQLKQRLLRLLKKLSEVIYSLKTGSGSLVDSKVAAIS